MDLMDLWIALTQTLSAMLQVHPTYQYFSSGVVEKCDNGIVAERDIGIVVVVAHWLVCSSRHQETS